MDEADPSCLLLLGCDADETEGGGSGEPNDKTTDGGRWAGPVGATADEDDQSRAGEVRMGCAVAGLFSLLACVALVSIVVVDLVAHFGPTRRELRWPGTYAAVGLTLFVVAVVWLWLWRVSVSIKKERKTYLTEVAAAADSVT
jgi:hypothetical protein